mmetsp:Transcript_64749/g.166610  ORF Transcript_64749/g.166610 Transcript_64749/m.166610 type:complete len:620 (+) Transcript_64749:1060-2919(+)
MLGLGVQRREADRAGLWAGVPHLLELERVHASADVVLADTEDVVRAQRRNRVRLRHPGPVLALLRQLDARDPLLGQVLREPDIVGRPALLADRLDAIVKEFAAVYGTKEGLEDVHGVRVPIVRGRVRRAHGDARAVEALLRDVLNDLARVAVGAVRPIEHVLHQVLRHLGAVDHVVVRGDQERVRIALKLQRREELGRRPLVLAPVHVHRHLCHPQRQHVLGLEALGVLRDVEVHLGHRERLVDQGLQGRPQLGQAVRRRRQRDDDARYGRLCLARGAEQCLPKAIVQAGQEILARVDQEVGGVEETGVRQAHACKVPHGGRFAGRLAPDHRSAAGGLLLHPQLLELRAGLRQHAEDRRLVVQCQRCAPPEPCVHDRGLVVDAVLAHVVQHLLEEGDHRRVPADGVASVQEAQRGVLGRSLLHEATQRCVPTASGGVAQHLGSEDDVLPKAPEAAQDLVGALREEHVEVVDHHHHHVRRQLPKVVHQRLRAPQPEGVLGLGAAARHGRDGQRHDGGETQLPRAEEEVAVRGEVPHVVRDDRDHQQLRCARRRRRRRRREGALRWRPAHPHAWLGQRPELLASGRQHVLRGGRLRGAGHPAQPCITTQHEQRRGGLRTVR